MTADPAPIPPPDGIILGTEPPSVVGERVLVVEVECKRQHWQWRNVEREPLPKYGMRVLVQVSGPMSPIVIARRNNTDVHGEHWFDDTGHELCAPIESVQFWQPLPAKW